MACSRGEKDTSYGGISALVAHLFTLHLNFYWQDFGHCDILDPVPWEGKLFILNCGGHSLATVNLTKLNVAFFYFPMWFQPKFVSYTQTQSYGNPIT